jgi:TPR repeat protein
MPRFGVLKPVLAATLAAALAAAPAAAQAPAREPPLDSRSFIERSVTLLKEEDYALARTYLAPALIDYRLTPGERSRAYYLRGFTFFAEGFYVSAGKDYARALEFNPDNPVALAAMADLYFRGLGVEADYVIAYQLYSKAAADGHANAQFHTGYLELEGLGIAKNLDSARGWLQKAADQDVVPAMIHMARSYRAEATDSPDPDQARAWYERAFAAGSADALVALAFMHQDGDFGAPDPEKALELFTRAAQEGSGAAQVSLAHMHITGELLPQDYAKALELLQQAARQGVPASYLGLGHMYDTGLGVKPDRATAENWYRLAAEAELLPAQLRLVRLLLREGDSISDREAMAWLARAARQDDPQAHNDYAWLLATHEEAELRDGDLAIEFAERAVARERIPSYLDTLAAAYAEAGRFEDAVSTQEQAIAMLDEAEGEIRAELAEHLDAYQAGRPWRE